MARPADLEEPEGFNMTPMIDITFQLIIFFMLVTDMSKQQTTPLKLPLATKAIKEKLDDLDLLLINVKDDGKMYINGQVFFKPPSDWSQYDAKLLESLFERRRAMTKYQEEPGNDMFAKYPVMVRADRSTNWQWVQMILAIATDRGGVTKVQLGAKMPQKGAQ